jgi:hypothetical protein
MIVPRPGVVPHALVSCSSNFPSPTTNSQSSALIAANTAVLRPSDVAAKEELTREAERQTLFQKVSNEILDIPNGYRNVEVLIIRWDESVDEFKGHDSEVCMLEWRRIYRLLTGRNRSKGFRLSSDQVLAMVVPLLGFKRAETHRST